MTAIPHIESNVPTNPDLHRDESGLNLASMDKAVDDIIDDSTKSCEDLYVSDLVLCRIFLPPDYAQVWKVEENLPSRRRKNCQVAIASCDSQFAIRHWLFTLTLSQKTRKEWQPKASIYIVSLTRNI